MKLMRLAACAAFACATLGVAVAHAGNTSSNSTEIPPGTYKASCWDIYVKKATLYASCSTSIGTPSNTSLPNYATANGQDIANCNGKLTIGGCH